jgi:transcriptional regulator with XRE-family HTH domain
MKKSTGQIDKEIGSRMRMRRMLIGMSQEKLGEMLGLTSSRCRNTKRGPTASASAG